MAEDEQEQSSRTEEPTQRRIEEAMKKGQVPFSREVANFFMLLLFTFIIAWFLPRMMSEAGSSFLVFIEQPHAIEFDADNARRLSTQILSELILIIAVPVILSIFAAIISSFMQNGFILSGEPIIPKLEKISPIKGLKRLFSLKSIVEFIKGLIKITAIGIIAYLVTKPYLVNFENLAGYEVTSILKFMSEISVKIMIGVCVLMFFIAVVDWLYQRQDYLKSLRMTKRELKEEVKQTEGDPIIRARLRQLRMERARQRMMAAVPKADVIITNPNHYAVALKYEQEKMVAPRLVAKGLDLIALQIKKIATEHKIPIVENPPLARALYEAVEIDEEIPFMHYQAVAEVIAYVYKVRKKSS